MTPQFDRVLREKLRAAGCILVRQGKGSHEPAAGGVAERVLSGRQARNNLADRRAASSAQVDRLLDPKNGSATIESLQRAASIVGRELRMQLV